MRKKMINKRFFSAIIGLCFVIACVNTPVTAVYAEDLLSDEEDTVIEESTETEDFVEIEDSAEIEEAPVVDLDNIDTEKNEDATDKETGSDSIIESEDDIEPFVEEDSEILSTMNYIDANSELTGASQVTCNYVLSGKTEDYTCIATPYDMHGKLSVVGTNIVDQYGNPVELRGVSLHGIQHTNGSTTAFKDYVNLSAFQILRDEWGVNLIRIPVYTAENGYCQGNAASMDITIQNAVTYATQLGMYVIIDWHILSDGNPTTYQSQAISFFSKYSAMYKNNGNVIYEICNEPNGADWNTVKNYAKTVIPYIRANSPDALICVGTPQWSQRVDQAAANPITAGDLNASLTGSTASAKASNVLYSIHFYSATHYSDIQGYVTTAHNAGLPIFCTEFGICDASGNGNYDISNANAWMNLLKSYNISFACWNLSNNNESSAMFLNSCTKLNGWVNSDLNTTGAWFINTVRPMYLTEIANYSSTPTTVYNGVDYSVVYDYDFYVAKYPDIKAAYGTNYAAVLKHFVTFGMQEGRQGSSEFNVTYYKNRYVDLRNEFGNNLVNYYIHYINYGKKEGRDGKSYSALSGIVTKLNGVDYGAVYDYTYYVNKYSDIKKAYGGDDIAVLTHFVTYGMKEGRQGISTFNVTSYAYQYYDLRKAYKNDLIKYYLHYINHGKQEGRVATGTTTIQGGLTTYGGLDYSAVYNLGYYANKYGDLRNAFGLDDAAYLKHFINYGMKEGRQGISTFNVTSYAYQYYDLRKAFKNDLKQYYLHYIYCGKKEGRGATGTTTMQGGLTTYGGVDYSAVYNLGYYANRYADLRKGYGFDDAAYLKHFINYGMKEGRQGSASFNVTVYRNRYSDLQKAYGSNLKSYYLHYINCGKKEGRKAV